MEEVTREPMVAITLADGTEYDAIYAKGSGWQIGRGALADRGSSMRQAETIDATDDGRTQLIAALGIVAAAFDRHNETKKAPPVVAVEPEPCGVFGRISIDAFRTITAVCEKSKDHEGGHSWE